MAEAIAGVPAAKASVRTMPKLSPESEGAQRTQPDRPLKAGRSADVVWRLSAVRSGRYTVVYGIEAGLPGSTKAVTTGGVAPGGSFTAPISSAPLDKEVTDSGEVVEK